MVAFLAARGRARRQDRGLAIVPIAFLDLYCIVKNRPTDRIDYLGLLPTVSVPVGSVDITVWESRSESAVLSKRRGWNATMVWHPPTDWPVNECAPCQKAAWVQDWKYVVDLKDPIQVIVAQDWTVDWDEMTYSTTDVQSWINGVRPRGHVEDRSIMNDDPHFWTPFLYWINSCDIRLRSSVKCIEGADKGRRYFWIYWGFNWEMDTIAPIGPTVLDPAFFSNLSISI